jgi:hypothetical protein
MGPRIDLYEVKERKFLTLPGLEPEISSVNIKLLYYSLILILGSRGGDTV